MYICICMCIFAINELLLLLLILLCLLCACSAAINEMSHFRGMIWTGDGRMREYEANDCPDLDSIHNDYQRHLPYLWMFPEFERQKLVKWGSGQSGDGHIGECSG